MKVYKITDSEFKEYGQILENYDFSELLDKLKDLPVKKILFLYQASNEVLESCAVKEELQNRGFGGMPIQIGYVGGRCHALNCLEYHKSSELNIALDDVVLVLGKQSEIEDGKYDLNKCKAFYVPAGTGVELFATTLHYAPMHIKEDGFRVACVLPAGTNTAKPEYIPTDTLEDKMYAAKNKWLMAHPYCEDAEYRYVGLEGKKIIFDMLEF